MLMGGTRDTSRPPAMKARVCLVGLFQLAEAVGNYPPSMRSALVALIDKADGGLRAITLFRSAYRVHSKLRSKVVKEWAKTKTHPAINMAAGRHVMDATYRMLMRQDGSNATGSPSCAADLLWDVRKAFDNVNRATLWGQGNRHNYPVDILRLSIASYGWGRYLRMGPIASNILFPHTGIAAGSAHATYEFTLYLLDAITAHETICPNATLSIHVDDISQSAVGSTDQEVIDLLTASSCLIISSIEVRLGMPFAEDKGQIVATSPDLARHLRLALGPKAGLDNETVKRLGVDYALSKLGRSKMPVRKNT